MIRFPKLHHNEKEYPGLILIQNYDVNIYVYCTMYRCFFKCQKKKTLLKYISHFPKKTVYLHSCRRQHSYNTNSVAIWHLHFEDSSDIELLSSDIELLSWPLSKYFKKDFRNSSSVTAITNYKIVFQYPLQMLINGMNSWICKIKINH